MQQQQQIQISTEQIRNVLHSLHFQNYRRWVKLNGELNRITLQQDLVQVLSLLPNFDFAYFNMEQFLREIADLIIDLQGIDIIHPTHMNMYNTTFLPDASIELFLDVHVATKLIRFVQYYYSSMH